ncbi:MAG: DUF4091 domain-containing protein, partial [Clostridia bacterium]|nr:DUF4091 domain-containing protein [Clostridia bacterium]
MVYNYMEMLLDYKVNCSVVTSDEETGYPDGSLADKIEWLGSFIDNDNWNSLDIFGTAMQGDYTSTCESANIIVEYVKEAVKISTPEKPYALYLTWYPAYFEEITEVRMPEFYPVWKTGGEWDKTIERIISEINEMPEFQAFTPEFQEQIVDAIKRIASANPCNYYEQWARDCTITFCPILGQFDDDYKVQRYKEVSQEYGNGKLWAYTCIGPYNPFPNFHISDYNLGTRVAGWMFKKYNVNGYLYFMINAYESGSYASDPVRYVDPYATANREYLCPGDGCLLYPGRYYGSDKPFASNRLVAYRDSMDDYDMLSVYERLLNEKAEKYGLTIDLDDYVMDLYDELFDGVDYKDDDELVLIARRTLANRILALKGDMELIATPIKSGMTIYSAKNTLV